jgi:hypothetical protein
MAASENREVVGYDDVIRHRCHNWLCINPEHLKRGSRADNKHDDRENWANGVDLRYLQLFPCPARLESDTPSTPAEWAFGPSPLTAHASSSDQNMVHIVPTEIGMRYDDAT